MATYPDTESKNILKQECIPVGCVPAARRPYAGGCFPSGVSAPGGSGPGGGLSQGECLSRGVWSQGGVCSGGGVWSQGGCLSQGSGPRGCLLGGVSQHALRQNPLPVNRMTDRCKNITLATTSLRPVIIHVSVRK